MRLISYILNLKSCRGQSLLEVVVAVALGALIVGSVVVSVAGVLRGGTQSKYIQTAAGLSEQYIQALTSIAASDWHDIYDLTKDTDYHIEFGTSTVSIVADTATTTVDEVVYTRSFKVNNVSRGSNGEIVTFGGDDDPSTQKITVYASWTILNQPDSFSHDYYLTRNSDLLFSQTDWSGGSGNPGPITATTTTGFDTSSNVHYSTSGQLKVEGY